MLKRVGTLGEGEYQLTEADDSKFMKQLGMLWDRATGGSEVAASPHRWTNSEELPHGPPAPGAREIVDWVLKRNSTADVPRFTFLVGGPGNGKSELTSQVVSALRLIEGKDSLIARRSYRYALGDSELLLVNDATIGLNGASGSTLAQEINSAVKSGSSIIANVNRGIIFEELDYGPKGFGKLVLGWLSDVEVVKSLNGTLGCSLHSLMSTNFLATAELRSNDSVVASLSVCFMDSCSLMESQPEVSILDSESQNFEFDATMYKITAFSKRSAMDLETIPAAILLERVISNLFANYPKGLNQASRTDPIYANLVALNNSEVQLSFLTMLRAGEIAASRLMTYRELWGAIARSVLGPLPQRISFEELQSFLDETEMKIVDDEANRFNEFTELADYRSFQALFGETASRNSHISKIDEPVIRLTKIVDAVRDVSPSWAAPIYDAFSLSTVDSSPLTDLREALLNLGAGESILERCLTKFDEELDRSYCFAMAQDKLNDFERNRMTGWYGRYLTRMYAFIYGKVAFEKEIEQWTLAWVREELSEELRTSLRTLILPTHDSQDKSLRLPVYSSRTIPVVGRVTSPKLVLKVDRGWKLKPRRKGESLFVDLMEDQTQIVQLELDFALMREALACKDHNLGVTEYVHATSPRLERFRAALLLRIPGIEHTYFVLHSDLEGGERVYAN